MTTTPNEPVTDSDIETTGDGLGSTAAPGATGPSEGSRDGSEGGPLDTHDDSDSDGSDSDGSDSDGSDSDGSDSDGSDSDGSDA